MQKHLIFAAKVLAVIAVVNKVPQIKNIVG